MMSNKPTVLVVDDEEFNLEIIGEYLEDYHYDLHTAADGAEAWEMLEAAPESFDVILLDRMMPNMDGMEVLARVKAHPLLQSVPVIMQTAAAAKQDVIDGLRAGAYYYLTKPFDEEVLQSIVQTALEDHQRYTSLREQIRSGTQVLGLLKDAHFRLQSVDEARNLAAFLANACPEPEKVVTGLSELLLNAVEHGNLGITYAEKTVLNREGRWLEEVNQRLQLTEHQHKRVDVHFNNDGHLIRIRICDQGEGFDWEQYLEIDPARVYDNHGRGIAMARMLSFDNLEYLGCGNEVEVSIAT
jgi:CheY-like chemotaxis protein/anti-sigma regulatory factor (Ser/Thr protein kinase)